MDDIAYAYVRLKLLRMTGIDLHQYKGAQVQRRLQAFLEQGGYPHWPAFFHAAEKDPAYIDSLRNYLGINVSAFFRDPDKYQILQDAVLPELLRGHPSLRVWSAGCSRGQEPYSLAVALAEVAGPYRQHQILASDIDIAALAVARAGGPYEEEEVAPMPPALRERYLVLREGRYWFADARLRRRVTFYDHNLLSSPLAMPDAGCDGYDLIACRNVVIYLTAESKDQLYQRLRDALRPGGVLFLGSTEILARAEAMGLEPMSMSFYRKMKKWSRS